MTTIKHVTRAAELPDAATLEQVLLGGDLSRLTPDERLRYYSAVCSSLGLNPLTKPLEYITLDGKLRLYVRKDGTEQLRRVHRISITALSTNQLGDVFVVTATATNAAGRTDVATGAVAIGNLRGNALADALMKAETKAKRRATLSICGLGMLDETEVTDIVAAAAAPHDTDPVTGEMHESKSGPRENPQPTARGMISAAQRRRLFAIARDHDWTVEQVRAYLVDQFGTSSTSELPAADFDRICTDLAKPAPATPANTDDPDSPF